MNPLSIIEQLKFIWELITSSPLYAIAFIIICFLVYLFATTNRSNQKESKKAYILIYVAAFIFFAIQYGKSFASLLDYAINQMFISYYFPTIIVYLLMFIISNIILWKTMFQKKIAPMLKLLNSVVFGVLLYLFILVLALINELKLNVFNVEELYRSNQVRSLFECSMFLFVIWVLFLIFYSLISKYLNRHRKNTEEEPINYCLTGDFNHKTFVEKSIKNDNDMILKDVEPIKKETTFQPEFTLEEYKMMAQILKNEKEKEQQSSLEEFNHLYKTL